MEDLTTGSITRHLLKTTSYMLVMMVFNTLYFLIDLYWVGRLGTDAVAGVGVAGNLTFIVLALMQVLGVGTTAVISHAAGQKDHTRAKHLFNQSMVLGVTSGLVFLVVAFAIRSSYIHAMSADATTAKAAGDFLLWVIPAWAFNFPLSSMGSALRGIGNFKPGTLVSTVTVILNMIIAPFLMFGWLTGHAFGVAGTAMASLISIIVGCAWLVTYFLPKDAYLHFAFTEWRPDFASWKRMLGIGLPTGFEFAMMAVYMALVYVVARPFGAAAQAGFGIGMRVTQSVALPVVALGFAVAPVAGQNFGARLGSRVKATFKDASMLGVAMMVLATALIQIAAAPIVGVFSKDPAVIAVGVEYLRVVSWAFVATGTIFVASSTFQAMGNTMPSLIASAVRILFVGVPVIALQRLPGFQLHWVWYISVSAVVLQLALSLYLLKLEFEKKLGGVAVAAPPASVEAAIG